MSKSTYNPKYITRLDQVPQLSDTEREKLKPVSGEFVFRTNEYYQSLINWDDPNDPINRYYTYRLTVSDNINSPPTSDISMSAMWWPRAA